MEMKFFIKQTSSLQLAYASNRRSTALHLIIQEACPYVTRHHGHHENPKLLFTIRMYWTISWNLLLPLVASTLRHKNFCYHGVLQYHPQAAQCFLWIKTGLDHVVATIIHSHQPFMARV